MAEKRKLLIAEGTAELRLALENELSKDFYVEVCADGFRAGNLLQSFRPDVLLLDLMLTKIDAISLLREIDPDEDRPLVAVSSRFFSDYTLGVLQTLPVDYLVSKPCRVCCVADRVRELAQLRQRRPEQEPTCADFVRNTLMQLGFSARVDGFSYLTEAIPLYMQDPDQNITKELYTSVGSCFHKSGEQVERSIRSAIGSAWERRDERLWRKLLLCGPDGAVPRPSNGEFISRMAIWLAEDIRARQSA